MIRIEYHRGTRTRYWHTLPAIFLFTGVGIFLYVIGVTYIISLMLFGLSVVLMVWAILFKAMTA
ncbi:MAG: hypothetical protein B2I17_09610 [Thermoplasmatales archaeon B_DKE]|nr:MAG: hypothetical protein B2I17_09610 [Thermoplasmatales archaeon B_DKE]